MLPSFSIKRPYTVIIGVIIVLILGTVSLRNMTTDLLPNINLPFAVVVTTYPGASPEEIELMVSRPIEQAMLSLSNIKNVNSISSENLSLVILEFHATANMDSAMIEMRESLDMLKTFLPSDVQSPMIFKLNPSMMPVMVLSAALEDQPLSASSKFLNNVVIPELESIEGVAAVSATGLVEEEVHVVINQEKIEETIASIQRRLAASMRLPGLDPQALMQNIDPSQFALTEEMISGILMGQNFAMPAGYLLEGGQQYLVRVGDRLESIEDLERLPLLSLPIVGSITLSEVADIELRESSGTRYAKVNGHDSIVITVQKQTEYSTADVAKRVRERMKELMATHEGLQMATLMDQGYYVDLMVGSVTSNLLWGGLLAILVLLVFLRKIQPTLIVGLSIPISVLTTFVLMYFGKISLNIVSLGGLALGVGMLVDNSIVVIENIYRLRNEGKSAKEAALIGAQEISGAIAASTLTTIAVFIPILFLRGMTREIFADMALTIAFSLTASLVVALTLVPTVASRAMEKTVIKETTLFDRIKGRYAKIMAFCIDKKWVVLPLLLVLFVLSIVGAFRQGTELFPATDTGQLSIKLSLPTDTSFQEATLLADELVAKIMEIDDVETVGAMFGGSFLGMGLSTGSSTHTELSLYVLLKEERAKSTGQVAQIIRERTEDFPGEMTINDASMDLTALMGGTIVVNIKGRDFATLEQIARDVAELVSQVEGVVEVSDGIEKTAPELRVRVDKQKSIARGLTTAQVFLELNSYLGTSGAATTLSIGPNQYDVFVSDGRKDNRLTREQLLDLTITNPQGVEVRIGDIATIEEATGYKSISRENQQRYLSVTAGLAEGYNTGLVSEKIAKKLADYKVPEGYTVDMGGEYEMLTDSFRDLTLMLILAVILIYLVMVAQFQSLLAPFIVMFTIPLGFTGGFLGLALTGHPVSIVAFLGLIILSGVVVNNGIVFVDYINQLRSRGMEKRQAIIEAGVVRLRPILMTAFTTILALSTLLFVAGTGTELIQPMAITAVSGLIYATVLTLILVPILYDLFHKDKKKAA